MGQSRIGTGWNRSRKKRGRALRDEATVGTVKTAVKGSGYGRAGRDGCQEAASVSINPGN